MYLFSHFLKESPISFSIFLAAEKGFAAMIALPIYANNRELL